MKLTVLGGGGVRSPFLARSILRQARALRITDVVFMDKDVEKLRIYGALARHVAGRVDPTVSFSLTSDPVEAVRDADYIITTLRVGQDEGRIRDERIALDLGVLGQETTGAGGFAMALRSIPALMEYCRLIRLHAKPGAMVFNFTNPSGLVTQALRSAGYDNVYGICDGPAETIQELEHLVGAPTGGLQVECFGLNHLSWYRSVKFDGHEFLPELLYRPELYQKTEMRFFRPGLAQSMGMIFNGYLYYFYNREEAVANILKGGRTRGETIADINRRMHAELTLLDMDKDFDKAVRIYLRYHSERNNSYMSIESGSARPPIATELDLADVSADEGGYAGVALGFIAAMQAGEGHSEKPYRMVLNVPNRGSIDGLADDDVVEITCDITRDGAKPIHIGAVPDLQMNLIRQVKLYERLAVRAVAERSRELARLSLMVHPLVNSYTLAEKLVDEYLEAHAESVGEWR
jgi:6-phospho-beta-glucosidase